MPGVPDSEGVGRDSEPGQPFTFPTPAAQEVAVVVAEFRVGRGGPLTPSLASDRLQGPKRSAFEGVCIFEHFERFCWGPAAKCCGVLSATVARSGPRKEALPVRIASPKRSASAAVSELEKEAFPRPQFFFCQSNVFQSSLGRNHNPILSLVRQLDLLVGADKAKPSITDWQGSFRNEALQWR